MHATLEAMDDFFRRASQAQRTSSAKVPKYELNGLRLSYKTRAEIEDKGVLAREMIGEYVRVAQGYAETVQAQRPEGREWKRLRKPIARLLRLKAEHERWEALRRLKSPPIGLARTDFIPFDAKTMKVTVLPGSPPFSTYSPFLSQLEESFRDAEKTFLR
jgi:hypothetical protein